MSHEKSKAGSEKHAGENKRPTCFIAMPLTIPKDSSTYTRERHFQTVLHTIMAPAVKQANFDPILPQFDGSVVIPQEIVEQLTSCDMVLGDISASNPNVFFECGMRVALDKPAAFVKDSKTSIIPFDVRTIGVETYDPFVDFDMYPAEITKIANHLSSTFEKSKGHNLAWKNYNMHQREKLTLEALKEGDVNRLVLERLDSMQNQITNITMSQRRSDLLGVASESEVARHIMAMPRDSDNPPNSSASFSLADEKRREEYNSIVYEKHGVDGFRRFQRLLNEHKNVPIDVIFDYAMGKLREK